MLESHKRIGKRLVPPLSEIGPWKEVSWVDEVLPELLWIGLLPGSSPAVGLSE